MKTDKQIIAEFRKRIDSDNYPDKKEGDCLLICWDGELEPYVESEYELSPQRIEDFVLNALKSQREELVKKIEGMKSSEHSYYFRVELEEGEEIGDFILKTYNIALDDVIKTIRNG